jgi:hypothetical protein
MGIATVNQGQKDLSGTQVTALVAKQSRLIEKKAF